MLGLGLSLQHRGGGGLRPAMELSLLTSLDPRVTFTRAGSATYFDSTGMMQTVAANEPRFDFDPVTLQPKGLLIEGSRTNLLLRSEELDHPSWGKQNTSILVNATVCPLGMADDLIETAAAGTHGIYQTVSVTNGTVYTFSFFVKAKGRTLVRAGVGELGAYAVFDLLTGSIQYSDIGAMGTITPVGGGMYRCSVTLTAATTATYTFIIRSQSSTSEWPGSGSYLGDGMSGLSVIGLQAEVGAYATSYIPTVGSAATRAADNATMEGTNFSSWFNQAEGTFAVDGLGHGGGTTRYLMCCNRAGGVYGPRHQIALNTFNAVSYAMVDDAGGLVVPALGTVAPAHGAKFKFAIGYKLNDFVAFKDGVSVGTDASGTPPTLLINMYLGRAPSGVLPLDGHISRLRYWRSRLSDEKLQGFTA